MNYIKQSWDGFTKTVKANKIKFAAFCIMFCALTIAWLETRSWFPVAAFIVLLVSYTGWIYRNCKLLCLLLAFLFVTTPAKPQQAGQVACGVAVVGVGVAATIYVWWWCNKFYPKPQTNVPPDELTFAASGSTAAASQVWFCDYCSEPPDLALDPLSHHGETVVRGTFGTKIENLTVLGPEQTVSRPEFQGYLTSVGLPLEFGTHYARDGVPCEPGQVPIRFTEQGAVPCVVIEGLDLRTNVVERSTDLATWTPILTNVAPAGMRFTFSDNSDAEQAFYRVR